MRVRRRLYSRHPTQLRVHHFIVGRDHAGVGDYYGLHDAHKLAERFDGELGINILRLHGPYRGICETIVTEKTCPHGNTDPKACTTFQEPMCELSYPADPCRNRLMRSQVVKALEGVPLL